MITLDLMKINKNIIYDAIGTKIDDIKENIESIKDFSQILNIDSISLLDTSLDESFVVLYLIKAYQYYCSSNQFDDCKCPRCKNNSWHFHKTYPRGFVFQVGKYLIESTIFLTVIECNSCKGDIGQHYHTLLPSFINPYHIYSADIILKTIYLRFIKQMKIENILIRANISRQLYYNWLKGLIKYIPSLLVLFSLNLDIKKLITLMYENKDIFPYNYFKEFLHPYFLFKKTCVPNQSLIRDFE